LTSSSLGAAQTPLTHICSLVQSVRDRQAARQRRSDAHTNPPLQDSVVEQSASAGSWQMVALPVFTQLWPIGQSADTWQASWQVPFMHACAPVQSEGD
jgi:hypothetical protein